MSHIRDSSLPHRRLAVGVWAAAAGVAAVAAWRVPAGPVALAFLAAAAAGIPLLALLAAVDRAGEAVERRGRRERSLAHAAEDFEREATTAGGPQRIFRSLVRAVDRGLPGATVALACRVGDDGHPVWDHCRPADAAPDDGLANVMWTLRATTRRGDDGNGARRAMPLVAHGLPRGVLVVEVAAATLDEATERWLDRLARRAALALAPPPAGGSSFADADPGLSESATHARLREELDRTVRYGGSFAVLMVGADLAGTLRGARGAGLRRRRTAALRRRLESIVRSSDRIGAAGADATCVIAPSTDRAAARRLARRIVDALAVGEPDGTRVSPPRAVCVGGTSVDRKTASSPDATRRRAEEALQRARRVGGGTVRFAARDADTTLGPRRIAPPASRRTADAS